MVWAMWSMRLRPGVGGRRLAGRDEFHVPDPRQPAFLVDEMQNRSLKPANGRDRQFAGADGLLKGAGPQGGGTGDGVLGRADLEPDVADTQPPRVPDMGGVAAVFLSSTQYGCRPVARDRFPCCGDALCARSPENSAMSRASVHPRPGGEFDEGHAVDPDARRDRRQVKRDRRLHRAHIVHQRNQRPIAVLRDGQ